MLYIIAYNNFGMLLREWHRIYGAIFLYCLYSLLVLSSVDEVKDCKYVYFNHNCYTIGSFLRGVK